MRTSRSSLFPLLLGSVALVVASCGDDDETTDDTESTTEATSATDDTGATDTTADGSDSTAATDTTAADGDGDVADGPTIVVGAQDFGESAILGQLYGQALADAGYPVEHQSLGGFRDLVYTSFDSGDINFTAEYAASALEFLNGFSGEASADVADTMAKLTERLAERGLQAFSASPAVDSNSFVVTAETAEELGLDSVSDLTEDLTLGGPPDCPDNASCIPGLIDVYGIDLSDNFVPLDGGGPLTVAALEGGEIDVAILFSTNSVIADKGWVVLEDDQGLINADNIVPITSDEVVDAYGGELSTVVDAVSAALTTEELTELNRQFDIDKLDAADVAAEWLAAEGLVE